MPRLKKGSPEAKAHMARIRRKGKKGKKATKGRTALPYEVKGKGKGKGLAPKGIAGKAADLISGYGEYGNVPGPVAPKPKKRRKRRA